MVLSRQILLVDDSRFFIKIVQDILSNSLRYQYEIFTAQTFQQSIEILYTKKIDVVLLDLNLAESRGIKTLENFINENVSSAIIVLTGMNDETIGYEAIQKGAQDFLIKSEMNLKYLEKSIEYARQREAFGQPLTGFQVTRHKLAHMATLVEAAKRFNYSVAAMIQENRNAYKQVCMAKNFSTSVCDKVVYDAVQIHGGYGYCREYLVERLYRDSRLFSIGGGTFEIMNEVIGKQMGL